MTTEFAASSMHRSPLDERGLADARPLQQIPVRVVHGGSLEDRRWVPSRFNIQTTTDDGELVLWNTFSGSMNVFPPRNRDAIVELLSAKGLSSPRTGIVEYLVDRGYLIEATVNELRRVQLDFGSAHYRTDTLELILLSSEDCNFRCTYCYEDFERGTMRPEVRSGVKKLVESRADKLRKLHVSWFGGEPLYGLAAIEDLAPYLLNLATQRGIEYRSHITTNGYLLTSDVVDRLLAWEIKDFQVTVDGAPEDHDRHRPGRDGQGTFDVIFANLRAMSAREEPFHVTIRINVDPDNLARLGEFLDLAEHVFASDDRFEFAFHAIGRWGGANDANVAVCGVEEIPSVTARLRDAARARGLKPGGGIAEVTGPGTQVCYAARPYNFIIGAAGQVMKCTVALDKQDFNVVGHLRENGTLELDNDKLALWTEPAFERDGTCQACVMLPSCQGIHCPLIRIEENRRPCPDTRRSAKRQMVERLTESCSRTGERDVRKAPEQPPGAP